MEQIVGVIAGVLTSASMFPQFIKLLKEKASDDVSIPMLIILIIGVGCWVLYGLLKTDMIILFTNAFSILLNIVTLILALKYRKGS